MLNIFKLTFFISIICSVYPLDSSDKSSSDIDDTETDLLKKSNVRGAKCNSHFDCGPREECAWLFGFCYRKSCYYNSDCFPHEYCQTRSKSRYGDCYLRGADGDLCLLDERCLSNHCHNLRCKGRQIGKNVEPNGRCEEAKDCRFEQYCNNKKCVDRVEAGSCKNDDQCLSNHCSFWKNCINTMLRLTPSNNNNNNIKMNMNSKSSYVPRYLK